jgi:Protein of unknown function (DUF2637)
MERHPDSASSPGFRADPAQAQTVLRRNWLHRLVNFAVAVVVLAVAAGTFFLSYPAVHAIARQGGVSGQLARFYPGLFDALLVIACVAAVMLRDARWWARCWAWLVAIVVLGAIGAADVLHAMSYGLRQRPTEGVVAAAPVAAVLLAFSLFLTMLRQSRPQSPDAALGRLPGQGPADGGAAEQPTAPMTFSNVETVPVLAAGAVPRPPAPPIALPAAPAGPPTADLSAAPAGPPTADLPADVPTARPPADDLPADDLGQGPHAPATVTETPEAAPTQEIPALAADATDADLDPGTAADREVPASSAAAPAETADPELPPTDQDEAVDPQAPIAAVASGPTSESTPEPPAESTPEPPAETAGEVSDDRSGEAGGSGEAGASDEPAPQPAQAPARPPQAIRYASSAAAEQFADEDWEAEIDPALAGQVYPVLTSDPDIEVPPHQPGQSHDLEDDAPPFATAPFATVPRLNRVRVTPTPPTDDGDADADEE